MIGLKEKREINRIVGAGHNKYKSTKCHEERTKNCHDRFAVNKI